MGIQKLVNFLTQAIKKPNKNNKIIMADTATVYLTRRITTADTRSKKTINTALRSGNGLNYSQKYGAGSNQQNKAKAMNGLKLDQENENFKHKTVSKSLRQHIIDGRNKKGFKQKDLAKAMNEPLSVVQQWESGKAIPDTKTINKFQKALGIYINGKHAGESFPLRKG